MSQSDSALVTSIPGGKLVCRHCKRECNPGAVDRPARCAPAHWVHCVAPVEECDVVMDDGT